MASPQQKADLDILAQVAERLVEAQNLMLKLSNPTLRETNLIVGRAMLEQALERSQEAHGKLYFAIHGPKES